MREVRWLWGAAAAAWLVAPACNCGNVTEADDDDGVDAMGSADAAATPDAGECGTAQDCEGLYGPAPCGMWECASSACDVVCPDCTDADGDGYGVDINPGGCAGPDCDDADDSFHDQGVRACYAGPGGTAGVGACRAGSETCVAGVLGPCVGEVLPSAEACNGADEDCDGVDDNDLGTISCGLGACTATVAACDMGMLQVCTPLGAAANDAACNGLDDDCDGPIDEDCACVRVDGALGNDAAAIATNNATPFQTIQAAIDWAAVTPTAPSIVCVSAGAACGATRTYAEPIVMANGISVYGNYQSTGWTQCSAASSTTTNLNPGVAEGVRFPDTINLTTVLDGFRVNRHNSATTAAVTVDGATNVILANLRIDSTPTVTNSYAINLINGAQALITRSVIYAGNGSAESIGVRSIASLPLIRDNCQTLDPVDGHCVDFCGSTNRAIRGRFTPGTGITHAVLLSSSPGAVVEQTAMCGIDADVGAAIKIEGDGSGVVVRANVVNAWGGESESYAIWMQDCGGAAPWIVDNEYLAASGDQVTTRVDGVRAIGDCHPVIDGNELITGGGEGGTSGANGVFCGANPGGTASKCVVLGNALIQGSEFGFPPTAVGVRCDDDGCARIANNRITGRGGIDAWGVRIGASSTVVESNFIEGGCVTNTAIGLYAEDAYARIENNVISAGRCNVGAVGGGRYVAMDVVNAAGVNELDVHSNTIDGAGMPIPGCSSTGLLLRSGPAAPSGPLGVYRNNIVLAGACGTRTLVEEHDATADPRVFEHNNLDPRATPPSIYLDEGTTGLQTAAEVDALADITASGTVSADSLFVSYPLDLHILAGSPCVDTGTPTGAPATDLEGDPRGASPDIGADER